MTQLLLDSGFEEFFSTLKGTIFNSRNNWFGVSVYEPVALFIRGNKKAFFGLGNNVPEGINTLSFQRMLDTVPELVKNMSTRCITLFKDDKIIYETFSGVMPSKEIINSFIQ